MLASNIFAKMLSLSFLLFFFPLVTMLCSSFCWVYAQKTLLEFGKHAFTSCSVTLTDPSSEIQQVHIWKCWNTDSSQSRWFSCLVTCDIWFKHFLTKLYSQVYSLQHDHRLIHNSKVTLNGNMMNVWQFNNWIIAHYWSYLMFYTERNIQTDDFFMISWKSPSYTCFVLSVRYLGSLRNNSGVDDWSWRLLCDV